MYTITFATSNLKKLQQVQKGLQENKYFSVVNKVLDIPEIQGEAEEVAIHKCISAANIIKGPTLIEDTSLACKSLGGLPGVYIKHFMSAIGKAGLANIIISQRDKSVIAKTIFAYTVGPHEQPKLFTGEMDGVICLPTSPSNQNDMWWDDIFKPVGYSKTFDMIPEIEKNKISARSKALNLLISFLCKDK